MDEYLQKYIGKDIYTIPNVLREYINNEPCQVVIAWYVLMTQTIYRHISLSSVRQHLHPSVSWDSIGEFLQLLFNINSLPMNNIQQLSAIGKGNMSVLLSHHNGRLLAVKQQLFHKGPWEVSSHIIHECRALDRVKYKEWAPNILYQHVSRDMLQIGMEYVPLSMKQVVRFAGRNVDFIRNIMHQLIRTIFELHLMGFAHRDIKPDNIRFRSDGSLVLIDYDSCELSIGKHVYKTPHVCTSLYRDPYLFTPDVNMDDYNYTSLDAFSCGCVYLYMLVGCRHVFYGTSDEEVFQCMKNILFDNDKLLNTIPTTTRQKLTPSDISLLKGLLHPDPKNRLSITAAYTAL